MSKNIANDTWQNKIVNTLNDVMRQLKELKTNQLNLGEWQTPTMQNGWVAFDSTYNPPGYIKFGDMVYLRGLIKSGSSGNIFVLPAGYRPAKRCLFTVSQNNALGRVDIDATGQVSGQVWSATWTSLDGICFRAEQ